MKETAKGIWNGKMGDDFNVTFPPDSLIDTSKRYKLDVCEPNLATLWEIEENDTDVLSCDSAAISLEDS